MPDQLVSFSMTLSDP